MDTNDAASAPSLTTAGRRAAAMSVGRIVAICVSMVLVYAFSPLEGTLSTWPMVRTVVSLACLVALGIWQLRAIPVAAFPNLRATEMVASTAVFSVVIFAAIYRSISHLHPAAFSEPLDRIGALYLSMATATTIGYGDIHAVSNTARIAVMVQMVIDVAVIAVGAKLAFRAAARTTDGQIAQ